MKGINCNLALVLHSSSGVGKCVPFNHEEYGSASGLFTVNRTKGERFCYTRCAHCQEPKEIEMVWIHFEKIR